MVDPFIMYDSKLQLTWDALICSTKADVGMPMRLKTRPLKQ